MTLISSSAEWKALAKLADKLAGQPVRKMFDQDPGRAARFSGEAAGLFIDFSKNKITDEVMEGLLALAAKTGLVARRADMFAGAPINTTENRAVLHTALRDLAKRERVVDGEDVAPLVQQELDRMRRFSDAVHSGARKGFSGEPLTTVVNIGIGGSDLGPVMVVEALKPYWLKGRRTRFVSNVDGAQIAEVLAEADPARTLFIVASKTFTTQETMTNARTAREWFLSQEGVQDSDVAKHFIALSTNEEKVTAFGIAEENMFRFWDWVGGRYSLWSAIGLSIALQVGFERFRELLAGAHAMDNHFQEADLPENLPALLALVGVWNRNFLGAPAHAVLPYDQSLHRLPAYLQQADMESNGKGVTTDGKRLAAPAGPVVFGEPGTNGQHSFHQLIHQGAEPVSCDFILPARSHAPTGDHHEKLIANALAQAAALMRGKTEDEARRELEAEGYAEAAVDALAPHKTFTGDRPATTILLDALTPKTLGALIALYEHKIFFQGVIWGVNSFDQWGVELGKQLAKKILPEIAPLGEEKPAAEGHDASTNALIDRVNAMRRGA
ncbi:MAG: glucose-6-phosphate isomerase [Pseudomonadota bacterium]